MNGRMRETGQLNKKNRRLSDAGFSLVELLIAVVILAIIVIPLLHMFVTSTRINVKSRQTLRATTVAQDIMEGLKAYDLEEVRAQFAPPEGASGSSYHYPREGFYILNSNLIQGGVREITELENPGDEIYYFGIENLKMQGGEYDAMITLDASAYGSGGTGHDGQFNDMSYAEIGSVSEVNGGGDEAAKATDSSYHQSKNLDKDVLQDFKRKIEFDISAAGGTLPDDWDDLKFEDVVEGRKNFSGFKRDMEIVLKDAGAQDAAGNEQCRASVKITYSCEYGGTTYTSHGLPGSAGGEVDGNISRTFSSGNFYLFYYPIYSVGSVVDTIKFTIEDEAKMFDEDHPLLKSIVVAKQVRSNVDTTHNVIAPDLPLTGPGSLQEKENAYKVHMEIGPSSPRLLFRSNLNTNLADGTDVPIGNITYDIGMANQIAIAGDNVSNKITNVIYDIEITVYKTGAAAHFTEPNFEDNDDVHKMVTITNLEGN